MSSSTKAGRATILTPISPVWRANSLMRLLGCFFFFLRLSTSPTTVGALATLRVPRSLMLAHVLPVIPSESIDRCGEEMGDLRRHCSADVERDGAGAFDARFVVRPSCCRRRSKSPLSSTGLPFAPQTMSHFSTYAIACLGTVRSTVGCGSECPVPAHPVGDAAVLYRPVILHRCRRPTRLPCVSLLCYQTHDIFDAIWRLIHWPPALLRSYYQHESQLSRRCNFWDTARLVGFVSGARHPTRRELYSYNDTKRDAGRTSERR